MVLYAQLCLRASEDIYVQTGKKMIKISRLADYAIQIIHALMPQDCLSASKIAEKTAIPEPTVSKILKKLAESGFLISVQGSRGGYQLSQSAEKISLAELITVMDGKPAMTECCKKDYDYGCAQESVCGQQSNWQVVNQLIFSVLDQISLQDMKTVISKKKIAEIQALQFMSRGRVCVS